MTARTIAHNVLLALDIDGTLIDTRASFSRIIRELAGIGDPEIRLFKQNGGFNDDWDLARAAAAWHKAGKPSIFYPIDHPQHIHSVAEAVAVCEKYAGYVCDVGDLTDVCIQKYRSGYWRDEQIIVDVDLLRQLTKYCDVVACTGRDPWELACAEEMLGFRFHAVTHAHIVKKPNPQALLRLLEPQHDAVLFLGDSADDRHTVDAVAQSPRGQNLSLWFQQIDVEAFEESQNPVWMPNDFLGDLLAILRKNQSLNDWHRQPMWVQGSKRT